MPATRPPPKPRPLPLNAADLQGLSRLAIDATVGVVDLVERLHHTITRRTGPLGSAPTGATRGITGLVYRSIRGTTRGTGVALDALLGTAARQLDAKAGRLPKRASPPARDAALAVLNGLWGDHLEATANPLAITMALRQGGNALTLTRDALAARFPPPSRPGPARLLVLVHGLCMNDRQWARDGHDHGQALARDLGFTPLYLHHNSGRHISHNGRDFSALLETLLAQWPKPGADLVLMGHSMGGLIARSAIFQAQQQGLAWPKRLRGLVCLGSPHHGAPLERGGGLVDRLLGISPYGAPFARLGASRSAGITDLRFGNLQDADWQGPDAPARTQTAPHVQTHDDRQPTPLPAGLPTWLVAATTADQADSWRSSLLGDGLVRLDSALGYHPDPALALDLPDDHRLVITQANHWDLLSSAQVYTHLRDWLR